MPRPLFEASHLNKMYGRQVVLDDVSFVVHEGQKIALIGRNGAGKSTLLRILTQHEEADTGELRPLPWAKLGVIAQHEALPENGTVEGFLISKSGKEPWEVRKLGARFGLTVTEMTKTPTALSGGYQMRVKIVQMLLQDPTLLLLDEPVNFLDLPTLLLLEKFLTTYPGSFILTAHDREFLQNTCTTTFEIERGRLTVYSGPVEDYLEFKEEQADFQRRHNKKLAREIAHHQEFVDRFGAKASLASRAQSKQKHIAKLRRQVKSIAGDLATIRFTIPCPPFVDGVAVRAEKLGIGYNGLALASQATFEVIRGQKVVLVGENGRGKSTLLKTLAGIIPPVEGTYKWWHRADIGYYDQHNIRDILPNETVLQFLTRMAPLNASGERILMMAGNFLFKNDDLEKPTSVLSGGERARLCLAGLLLHEHNVLLLDEPTNHLDVETAENLAESLKSYKGTVIVVSHARTFVNALAERVFEIRAGAIREYIGTYEDYVTDLLQEADQIDKEETMRDTSAQDAYALRKVILKEKRRLQEKLDKQITETDKEKSAILAFFFENPTDYAPEKARRLTELTEILSRLESQWLHLQEEIDAIGQEKIS